MNSENHETMTGHRLTHAQEIALAERIQAGDTDARNELITANLGLVYRVAHNWCSSDPTATFDDRVQEGMLGLLRAAEKYDPARGTRFSTYATWWINQKVQRLVKTAGPIKQAAGDATPAQNPRKRLYQQQRRWPVLELDAPLPGRKGEDGSDLHEMLPDGSDVEREAVNRVMAAQLLRRTSLTPAQRGAVTDWMAGWTARDARDRNQSSDIKSILKKIRYMNGVESS